MKKIIAAAAAAFILLGCGDDTPTSIPLDDEQTFTVNAGADISPTELPDWLNPDTYTALPAPPEQVYVAARNDWATKFEGRWKMVGGTLGWNSREVIDIHPVGTENPVSTTNLAFPTLNHRGEDTAMDLAYVWYMLWNIDEERNVIVLLTRRMAAQGDEFRDAHGEEQVWSFHEVGYTEVITSRLVNGEREEKRELILRTHSAWAMRDVTTWEYVGESPSE